MKETARSRNFAPNVVIQKIKKVSCNIMQNIQDTVIPQSRYKEKMQCRNPKNKDNILSAIKGKDTTLNAFLKVSSLLCKVLLIEGKIKEEVLDKDLSTLNYEDATEYKVDIEAMHEFISKYSGEDKKSKKKGK